MASLAREGFQPAGDLIFVAAADEEVGDDFGLAVALPRASRRPCAPSTPSTRAPATGRARRAAALPLLDRREDELAVHAPRPRPQRPRVDAGDRRQRARQGGGADRAARRVTSPSRGSSPRSSALVEAVAGAPPERGRGARGSRARSTRSPPSCSSRCSALTLSPTMISASQKRNVIPALCEVDGRLPPAARPDAGRGRAGASARCSATATTSSSGSRARAARGRRLDTPLWDAIEAFVAEIEPEAAARADLPCAGSPTATGCARPSGPSPTGSSRCATMDPQLAARLIHSADERARVDDLELGVALPAPCGPAMATGAG